MKLLYCPACHDVRRLWTDKTVCRCGRCWGRYKADGLQATYGGLAIPLGIDNGSFSWALYRAQPPELQEEEDRVTLVPNPRFDAWIITSPERIEREEE